MPNSKDAAKRHKQSLKRRIHNRSIRSQVRTSVKTFEVAVAGKDKAVAESAYADFVKLIDTASGKGLYHRNTAARKKSRMHKRLDALA
ncbi:MAG: 30S ribosomal protein S20 [Spirochaetaceae bacterium]|nr:30S ribosomal protein S20 [Spirochaetaceae bacterium]MDT8297950.1 30S ribosomal protein S20 [Spirochaetaceae bacterium]